MGIGTPTSSVPPIAPAGPPTTRSLTDAAQSWGDAFKWLAIAAVLGIVAYLVGPAVRSLSQRVAR